MVLLSKLPLSEDNAEYGYGMYIGVKKNPPTISRISLAKAVETVTGDWKEALGTMD